MRSLSFRILAASSLAAVLSQSAPVLAQQSAKPKAPKHEVEEIIVSARKRDESIQDVPLSVTPFTMEQMEQRAFNGVEDLAAATPGFTYEGFSTSGTNGNAVIRGLAQQFTTSRIQNVAFFIDGVYMQRQSMLNMGLIDMQRVEIVKGPQNALYGRNAFAGAVNYVTTRPTVEPGGNVSLTLGSDERADVRFGYTGPLGTDRLLGKFSYGYTTYDGHHDNDHSQKDADPSGPSSPGRLGGWEDTSYATQLTFDVSDSIATHLGFYHVEIIRDTQPAYQLSGIGARKFGLWEQDDLNCLFTTGNTQTTNSGPSSFDANSAYCGELPAYAGEAAPRSYGDDKLVVDPRGWGAEAETDLATFAIDWDINENMQIHYLFGWTDHSSTSTGGPGGEDPEIGQSLELGTGDSHIVYTNSFSSRPNSILEATSHEFRFDWHMTDRLRGSFGAYYSEVEDEQWTLVYVSPVCSSGQFTGQDYPDKPHGQNANTQNFGTTPTGNAANCDIPLGEALSPVVSQRTPQDRTFYVAYDLGFRQHGKVHSEDTAYADDVTAFFFSFSYDVTDNISATIEARYTEENKTIQRRSDSFGIPFNERIVYDPLFDPVSGIPTQDDCPDPENPFETGSGGSTNGTSLCSTIVSPSDAATFHYFTPRMIVEWSLAEHSMVYFSAAKGVKAGGFNNAVDPNQQTFDEAENWTYEIGTKNQFLDRRLTVNAALYYIDWTGLQGGIPPAIAGLSTSDITENIGDTTSVGLEAETTYRMTDNWTVNLGLSLNDPKYRDGVIYSPSQRRDSDDDGDVDGDDDPARINCWDSPLCNGDGEVGGNQLARTSKVQANGGIAYRHNFENGWLISPRIDITYQSRQYLTPVNLAWVPSRTIVNASMNILDPNDKWEFNIWGKNILNEDKAANAFYIGVFNQYLAAKVTGPSFGAQVKYNL